MIGVAAYELPTRLAVFPILMVCHPGGGGGGGTCQNFDRDARPIFWVSNLAKSYFSGLANFFSYFSGFCKISAIFLGLTNFQLFFWVFQFL